MNDELLRTHCSKLYPFEKRILAYLNSLNFSSVLSEGTFFGFSNGPDVTSPRAASMRDTKAGSNSSDFMISGADEAQPGTSRVQSKPLSESERCVLFN
jgi:hypothetical protein